MTDYVRRFWVEEPRHSESISAKKRYTLIIPLYRSTRHFRRFWVKEPRHSENISAKKRYTLIPPYRSTRQLSFLYILYRCVCLFGVLYFTACCCASFTSSVIAIAPPIFIQRTLCLCRRLSSEERRAPWSQTRRDRDIHNANTAR